MLQNGLGLPIFTSWFQIFRLASGIHPLCKKREIFEKFLENKIEFIPMFPLI